MSDATPATMKATWTGGKRFECRSTTGHTVVTDAPKDHGGTDSGPSPMEMLVLGLLGCTGIDVSSILVKMREPVEKLEVTATVERADLHPRIYTKIHLHYVVTGSVAAEKLERAIRLSEDKFCSASAMLGKTAEISSDFEICDD